MDETPRCYRHPDRETLVSCSECGRPICEDCMSFAPVGIRCPDHAAVGGSHPGRRHPVRATEARLSRHGPFVTKALIGVNVGIFALQLLMGAGITASTGWIYENGVLFASGVDTSSGELVGVAQGEWWRLATAMFLHYGPIHLFMNMLLLWFIGPALEAYLGHARFALLYLVSGLAGSAGALLWSPNALTVGASGAIWGIMGAALILEWKKIWIFGGQALGLVVLNLAITFLLPGISKGGHVGGLVGGAVAVLAFMYLRTPRLLAPAAVAGIGVASVALAYASV